MAKKQSIGFFIILLFPLQLLAQSNHEHFQTTYANKSEEICKTSFVKNMLVQQTNFSDSKSLDSKRREAEQRIDNARKVLEGTGSFCEANMVLIYEQSDVPVTSTSQIHKLIPDDAS